MSAALTVAMIAIGALGGIAGYLELASHARRTRPQPAGAHDTSGTESLPLNTLDLLGHRFLRVVTGRSPMVHLAPTSAQHGRSAIDAHHAARDLGHFAGFDTDCLLQSAWTRRTMCGLPWLHMADYTEEIDAVANHLNEPAALFGCACALCLAFAEQDAAVAD